MHTRQRWLWVKLSAQKTLAVAVRDNYSSSISLSALVGIASAMIKWNSISNHLVEMSYLKLTKKEPPCVSATTQLATGPSLNCLLCFARRNNYFPCTSGLVLFFFFFEEGVSIMAGMTSIWLKVVYYNKSYQKIVVIHCNDWYDKHLMESRGWHML